MYKVLASAVVIVAGDLRQAAFRLGILADSCNIGLTAAAARFPTLAILEYRRETFAASSLNRRKDPYHGI
jgi:hypothetical protein